MKGILLVAFALGLSLLTPTFAQDAKDPKYIIITGFFAVLIGTTADLLKIANGHLPA